MASDNVFAAGVSTPPTGEGSPEQALLLYVRQTQPWLWLFGSLFALSTVMLLGMGGMVAVAGTFGAAFGAGFGDEPEAAWIGPLVGGLYGALGVVYVIPTYFMIRSAIAARPTDLATAAEAIRHQRNVWRAFGFMSLAAIALYVGVIVLLLGVGMASTYGG